MVKPFGRFLFSLIGFSAVVNILMLVPPWYMLQMYDRVLTSYDENTLLGLSLIALFLYCIYGLIEKFRSLLLIKISSEIEDALGKSSREKIFSN